MFFVLAHLDLDVVGALSMLADPLDGASVVEWRRGGQRESFVELDDDLGHDDTLQLVPSYTDM